MCIEGGGSLFMAYNRILFYIWVMHIVCFARTISLVHPYARSGFSAPIVPGGEQCVCAACSPLAAARHCRRLHTMYSIHSGVWRAVVASVELSRVQGCFSLSVNILDLGPHRWWETMDWDLTGHSVQEQGLLKDHSLFLFLGMFTTNHAHITFLE